MLKRIKIHGYKSLVDLELDLKPLSVLVGPNASGKSNFLDALQLLSRMSTCHTLEEAFEPPYRGHPLESFTFGDEGIKSLLKAGRYKIGDDFGYIISHCRCYTYTTKRSQCQMFFVSNPTIYVGLTQV